MMDLRRVCVYSYRITNEQLMLSALVPFQSTELTKSFLAHIAFVRFLVRVNTHVALQTTRFTKSFIAKITFIRPLVRVNTHVSFQITRLTKSFLAHIALVLLRSLSLRSFLNKSRFFFLYLVMICLEIIILVRNPQTQHRWLLFSFFFPLFSLTTHLQNRPRVHRALRVWILSSHSSFV